MEAIEPRSDQATGLEIEVCWSTKGVYGTGACPQLQKLVHCRNCPDYSQAALRLLDRTLPPAYRREWSDHFAQRKHLAAPGKTSVVIFRLGAEWLALPAGIVQEIAEKRRIHSLPHRQGSLVLGLVNFRGELVICASIGRLLGLEGRPPTEVPRTIYDRLLVAVWSGQRFVFPAQEVYGVHRLHAGEVQAPPMTVAKASPTYTRGLFAWREQMVGLLDADLLFPALSRSLS
jgi:chemotaxis-related protein WspD